MTNSQKTQLVHQYDEPNTERIRSLLDEGYSRQEAEEIDRLERRECVLNELGAAGDLTDKQRDELDTIQTELLDLVGSPHVTYAGTMFAGDGAPVSDDAAERMSVDDVTEAQVESWAHLRPAVESLDRYRRTGDEASLRIAMRHAEKAEALEDCIDRALTAAVERDSTPAP